MKCLHKHCTLCGEYDRGAETFVAWQCDDCGMIGWNRDVSEDELYRTGLPAIDRVASVAAIRALEEWQPMYNVAKKYLKDDTP